MLETTEDIEFALDYAGEILEFCCGNLRAVPGSDVYLVQNNANDLEVQQYIFMTSDTEYRKFNLEEDQTFKYVHKNLARNYEFKIDSFLFDITGWVMLYCSYVGVENV